MTLIVIVVFFVRIIILVGIQLTVIVFILTVIGRLLDVLLDDLPDIFIVAFGIFIQQDLGSTACCLRYHQA